MITKKRLFVFLILFIHVGLASAATFPAAPENLTATASIEGAFLEWDNVTNADNYTICNTEPTILYANWTALGVSPPTQDGIIDQDVANVSQKGVMYPPNPVNPQDPTEYDYIYAIYDDTTMYMAAETHDGDSSSTDDQIGVWYDFNQDGLTNDDIGYTFYENGNIKREQWDEASSSWKNYGGSGATLVVGGAGTNNVIYEVEVPLSEFPITLAANHTDLVVQRVNTAGATTVSFFPYSTANSTTNPAGWQELYVETEANPANITCFNVSDNYYNLIDLDSVSWYRIMVAAINSSVVGNFSTVDFITLNYPTYNVSGRVLDEQNNKPVVGAIVDLTDTFTIAYDVTDSSGNYNLYNLPADDYTITASYQNINSSIDVTVIDTDLTEQDIYIEVITNIDLAQTNIITATDDSFQFVAIVLIIIVGFGLVLVLAGMATGNLSPFVGTVVVSVIVIGSILLMLGLYLISSFARFLP